MTHGELTARKTSTDILIMEGVAAAKNLGEEVEETVTLIRKIGLMVDLSGVERARGRNHFRKCERERWAEEGNAAIFYLEDNQRFPPPSPPQPLSPFLCIVRTLPATSRPLGFEMELNRQCVHHVLCHLTQLDAITLSTAPAGSIFARLASSRSRA